MENEGFEVVTANRNMEVLNQIRSRPCDLVVLLTHGNIEHWGEVFSAFQHGGYGLPTVAMIAESNLGHHAPEACREAPSRCFDLASVGDLLRALLAVPQTRCERDHEDQSSHLGADERCTSPLDLSGELIKVLGRRLHPHAQPAE